MMKRKKRLSKGIISSIVVAAVILFTVAALLITNAFVPVKYLSSYTVIANDVYERGVMRVRFLNVGYGDCTVVELPDDKTMLIDGGDGRYSTMLGVLKTLNKSGIKNIDYLVCTSVKSEHCGGLAEIVKYKNVKTVFMPYCKNTYITSAYRDFYKAVSDSGAERRYIEYGVGEYEQASDYFFCFLSPSAKDIEGGEYDNLNSSPSAENVNNASAVMWLACQGINFLFLGDVQSQPLEKLCSSPVMEVADGRTVDIRDCDFVQVANHGDEVSACAMFYDLTEPQGAIISVGENARGCPSQQVLSDVSQLVGDKLYRTDKNGTVTITVKNGVYRVL